ncbi:solute carrier organic anion transporter family member 6C1-like [Arvicanthis niloticus]|uniref:solute carrier organic anion transporter family member 6C1-like n=1 Tax=Arvicanthis niloticus TaxID=61156 RepID=UPI00148690FA|nr:solute carrier organic anion transporter family member 6A1-like [Arvicanthis niloticus]
MAPDKRKQKDTVKQGTLANKDEHQRTEEPRKIETYLVTLPTALKKFADIPDTKKLDPDYNDSSEGPFGLGPLVFPCLQRFNNIEAFMFLFCVAVFTHGMMFALIDLTLKVFATYFSASNTEIFLMDFADYFAAFLVATFVGYFGGRGNKAKWVAAATFVTGLSAIVYAAIFLNYEVIKMSTIKTEDLCEEGKKPKPCGVTIIPHKSICLILFIFGQFLHGIAGMPLYILATTFIFDHVPTFSSGLYLAISDAAVMIGYLLGFLLGVKSFMLPVKEVIKSVGRTQFQTLQSHWWTTFIFVALASFCTSLPLLCFPSSLPGAHKLRLQKAKEPPTIDKRLKNMKIGNNLKSILYAIWCLLRNPLVLTQTFCKVTESVTFKASFHFMPLYLQTQFLITPKHSTMITGLFILPGCIIGHFAGGYIIDKLQMSNKNKLKFISVVSVVAVALFLLTISVACETAKFQGINDDYDGLGRLGNLTAPCNEKCGCTTSTYNSVCGRDENQYFSPCFAGCRATKSTKEGKTHYNCSCIKEGLTAPDDDGQYIDAVSGTCNTKCLSLPLFFAFYFSSTVFSNFASIPSTIIIIGSVPASWRSMALGVTYTIWRFIGAFPVPIIFPELAALACNFWDINECGIKVRCWIYKEKLLDHIFLGIWFSLQVATGLLCLYAVYRHDYVVKETTKNLDVPVKRKKAGKGGIDKVGGEEEI